MCGHRQSAAHVRTHILPVLRAGGMVHAMLHKVFPLVTALFLAPSAFANTGPAPLTPAPAPVSGGIMAPGPKAPEAQADSLLAVSASPRPVARRVIPEARWGTGAGRTDWSLSVLSALRGPARALPATVPADIAQWCPAYPSASRDQREAFWLGLVSALAKHESTWRPTAVGGGGQWVGLLQILPATARGYGCEARSAEALKNPRLNLACGMRIMARTVKRDGVISHNMRGVAADWGPFHSRSKREDMMAWTRSQDYCSGLARSLRPVARPEALTIMAGGPSTRPLARPKQLDAPYAREIIATKGRVSAQEDRRTSWFDPRLD